MGEERLKQDIKTNLEKIRQLLDELEHLLGVETENE